MKIPEILVCTNCEDQNYGKSKAHGSFLLEIALWIAFIVIAAIAGAYIILILPFIYTLYRFFNRTKVCSKCESPSLIPISSAKVKKILKGKDE